MEHAPRRTFRPAEHITRRADFEAVYGSGVKLHGRLMTLFARPNDNGYARLGIAATRKLGGAVVRNRAKRLTRELFRTLKPVAPLDLVVVPRREFLDAPYQTLEREFDALLERAARAPAAGSGPGAEPGRRARARAHSRV